MFSLFTGRARSGGTNFLTFGSTWTNSSLLVSLSQSITSPSSLLSMPWVGGFEIMTTGRGGEYSKSSLDKSDIVACGQVFLPYCSPPLGSRKLWAVDRLLLWNTKVDQNTALLHKQEL